jgi:hypothetical protein
VFPVLQLAKRRNIGARQWKGRVVYDLFVNHGRSSANTEVTERFLLDDHASAGFLRRVVVVGVGKVSRYRLSLACRSHVVLSLARFFRAFEVLALGTLLFFALQFLVAVHTKTERCHSRIVVLDGYKGRRKAVITSIIFVHIFFVSARVGGRQVICDITTIKKWREQWSFLMCCERKGGQWRRRWYMQWRGGRGFFVFMIDMDGCTCFMLRK